MLGLTANGSFTLLVMALILLIKSADVFIEAGIGIPCGLPEVVIGLTIVSIGTSLPEILVTSAAADILNPQIADLAIGGIYGSIWFRHAHSRYCRRLSWCQNPSSWLKRDGFIMFSSIGLLTLFLFTGGALNRIEGAILMSLYIAYVYWLLSHREKNFGG